MRCISTTHKQREKTTFHKISSKEIDYRNYSPLRNYLIPMTSAVSPAHPTNKNLRFCRYYSSYQLGIMKCRLTQYLVFGDPQKSYSYGELILQLMPSFGLAMQLKVQTQLRATKGWARYSNQKVLAEGPVIDMT